ncbi:putative nicalin [Tanacetum coccineum]
MTEATKVVIDAVISLDMNDARYKLIVSSPAPKKLSSPTITNIQGWLPGPKADGETSFQLSPLWHHMIHLALSVGSDSNGSGVVALLEIARLFSILYSNPNTRGRYNILFGLTSGGPYNYNRTQKWLRSFDQRLRESIDYASCLNSLGSGENGLWLHVSKPLENAYVKKIFEVNQKWLRSFDQRLRESIDYASCLNSLGSGENGLWLHVSKPLENAYVKQIFEGLSNVAEEVGLTVGLKHKKINVSNSRVAWEHEQFLRLRVTAATLSGLSAPPELLESTGGLFDNREFVNEAAVVKSEKVVAESLALANTSMEDNPLYDADNVMPSSVMLSFKTTGMGFEFEVISWKEISDQNLL